MRIPLRAAIALILVGACSDSTKPVDPASVASISLPSTTTTVLIDAQTQLALSARDSAGNELTNVKATWESGAPSIASVSNDGVVTGVGYGTAAIVATVGTHSAVASVVVLSPPTTKAYSVVDLGSNFGIAAITRQFSDSGDVLEGQSSTVYRRGAHVSMTGCTHALAINGPGHVLCKISAPDSVSSYAIWRNGSLSPLASVDTFKALNFRAFALNDSDEVAGLFYLSSSSDTQCLAVGSRCLAIWKDGSVFVAAYSPHYDVMLMNNRQQIVDERMTWADAALSAVIHDVATGTQRSGMPWGVHALNDNAWGAVEMPYISHSSATSGSSAYVMTPDSLLYLGRGGATGINNSNVVVGTLDIGPFIWRGQGVSLLTNASTDPSWTIIAASEINNRGQILATADNTDGRKAHSVILTPTQP